jgi:hypothetical protein
MWFSPGKWFLASSACASASYPEHVLIHAAVQQLYATYALQQLFPTDWLPRVCWLVHSGNETASSSSSGFNQGLVKDCLDVLAASIDAEAAKGCPDLQVTVDMCSANMC